MISLKTLQKYKLTPKDLQSKFDGVQFMTGDTYNADPVAQLVQRISHRMKSGMWGSIRDSRLWHAIDKAYDAPFYQINPTLVEDLISRDPSQEKVQQVAKEWGLTHLLVNGTCNCPGTCTKKCTEKKILDLPTFFRVLLPLVKSYVTIRRAKLFGDRNLVPLFKYEPLKSTALNRLRCEIITDRVQMMSAQMGYGEVVSQAILHMLLYSQCFMFPKEQWYSKHHEDNEGERKLTKEGIRFHTPHPSRLYFDDSDRPGTFNTSTGCSFAGYWNIVPWRTIMGEPQWWNKDKVAFGYDWINAFPSLFSEIYQCSAQFPSGCMNLHADESNQRAASTATVYYNQSTVDKAVSVVEHFEELIPSECGLGDYDEPIWVRFVMAARDTVLYCQPFAYRPISWMGYDFDGNRTRNASLALETMPWQDHLGNLLSQYILSVKTNLMKVIPYNSDMFSPSEIAKIKNLGEKQFRAPIFLPYSAKEHGLMHQNVQQQGFNPVNFQPQNTQEIMQAVMNTLTIMERMLGMSSQELGAAASHQQSATETNLVSNNTSIRVSFTGASVDDGISALKTTLYEGTMTNGHEDVWSQIQTDSPLTIALLQKLGFQVVDEKGEKLTDPFEEQLPPDLIAQGVTLQVKGKRDALMLEGFASNRDADARVMGDKVAQSMVQLAQIYAQNPLLFQAIGVEQFVKFFNMFAVVAGMPKDFRLKPTANTAAAPDQIMQQVQQLVVEANKQLATQIADEGLKPLQQALQNLGKNETDTNQAVEEMHKQLQQLQIAVQKLGTPAPSPVVGLPPENVMPMPPQLPPQPAPLNAPVAPVPIAGV